MARLVHEQSGKVLAERLEIAHTTLERMRGLLGRGVLLPGGGMMIERCASIHTCFMRFPIDVMFVDSSMMVTQVAEKVRPWRLASALGSRHAFELPAGALRQAAVCPGDILQIEDSS